MLPFLKRQYSNGADGNTTSTAQDTGANLGGGSRQYPISTKAIIAVVTVIVVVLIGGFIAWYVHKLDLRRKVDARNKQRAAAMHDDVADPVLGRPGDPIPLDDLRRQAKSGQTSEKAAHDDKDLPAVPPSAKMSLWHYIHWKDPLGTKVVKVKPGEQNNAENPDHSYYA